jgi:hypothetical protein
MLDASFSLPLLHHLLHLLMSSFDVRFSNLARTRDWVRDHDFVFGYIILHQQQPTYLRLSHGCKSSLRSRRLKGYSCSKDDHGSRPRWQVLPCTVSPLAQPKPRKAMGFHHVAISEEMDISTTIRHNAGDPHRNERCPREGILKGHSEPKPQVKQRKGVMYLPINNYYCVIGENDFVAQWAL